MVLGRSLPIKAHLPQWTYSKITTVVNLSTITSVGGVNTTSMTVVVNPMGTTGSGAAFNPQTEFPGIFNLSAATGTGQAYLTNQNVTPNPGNSLGLDVVSDEVDVQSGIASTSSISPSPNITLIVPVGLATGIGGSPVPPLIFTPLSASGVGNAFQITSSGTTGFTATTILATASGGIISGSIKIVINPGTSNSVGVSYSSASKTAPSLNMGIGTGVAQQSIIGLLTPVGSSSGNGSVTSPGVSIAPRLFQIPITAIAFFKISAYGVLLYNTVGIDAALQTFIQELIGPLLVNLAHDGTNSITVNAG